MNVQHVISGKPDTQKNDFEAVLHMPFSEAVDYLECALGIIAIDIELSKLDEAEAGLQACFRVVSILFRSKDSDMARRIKILWLNLAKDKLNFELRNQVADELSDIYQNYDHYRLLRCEDFMQFVKERIVYLIDDCKHDEALVRVENILTVLDIKKARYWHDQFRILLAKCLINLRRPQKAYDILQEILHNRVIKKDETPKMKDYRLFVDVHMELGMAFVDLADYYYSKEEYKSSLKCLKYTIMEYFNNEKLFDTLKMTECLRMANITLEVTSVLRKMHDFDGASKYLKSRNIIKFSY